MRLSHESGYLHDVAVPLGKTAVSFLVTGGPAACHVYRADDLGARWIWIASRTVGKPGHAVRITVTSGWLIRLKILPLDEKKAMRTVADVSFCPRIEDSESLDHGSFLGQVT